MTTLYTCRERDTITADYDQTEWVIEVVGVVPERTSPTEPVAVCRYQDDAERSVKLLNDGVAMARVRESVTATHRKTLMNAITRTSSPVTDHAEGFDRVDAILLEAFTSEDPA